MVYLNNILFIQQIKARATDDTVMTTFRLRPICVVL